MATFGRPFKPVEQKFRKGKLFSGGTSYFNQGAQQPTGSMSTQIFSKPPPPRPSQPPATVTPPVPPVTLGRNTRYFKEDRAVTIDPGAAGRVNPPAPPPVAPPTPPVDPFANTGSVLTNDIMQPIAQYFQTHGGMPNQFNYNQMIVASGSLVSAMRNNRAFAQQVMGALGLPVSWLGNRGTIGDSAKQQQFYQKLFEYMQYAHPGDTATGDTDYSIYLIPTTDARTQLVSNEGYRTRYLEFFNKTFGSHLGMSQFMAILNSADASVIKIFEQMHERLRSALGTGGARPPTGGVGA